MGGGGRFKSISRSTSPLKESIRSNYVIPEGYVKSNIEKENKTSYNARNLQRREQSLPRDLSCQLASSL